MEKYEIFTFKTPNGVEVKAVCLEVMCKIGNTTEYLCYAQNHLFTRLEFLLNKQDKNTGKVCQTTEWSYGRLISDNCILPDWDAVLEMQSQESLLWECLTSD
jgi:hypothetical protein